MIATLVMLMHLLIGSPIDVLGKGRDVKKQEEITVTIKAKPTDIFELKAPPVRNVEKVVVDKDIVEIRIGFEMPAQIIDIRGEHDGWELSVSATHLTHYDTGNKLPKGTISLEPLQEIRAISENAIPPKNKNMITHNAIIDDGDVLIVKADEGEGMGIFELDFGEQPLVVYLNKDDLESGKYKSNIIWSLESGSGEKRILQEEALEFEIVKTETDEIIVDETSDQKQGAEQEDTKKTDTSGTISPNSPTDSEKTSDNTTATSKKVNDEGKPLPTTATSFFNFILYGLVVLTIGVFFFFVNERIRKKRYGDD